MDRNTGATVSREDYDIINQESRSQLKARLSGCFDSVDRCLILLSDYGKGAIDQYHTNGTMRDTYEANASKIVGVWIDPHATSDRLEYAGWYPDVVSYGKSESDTAEKLLLQGDREGSRPRWIMERRGSAGGMLVRTGAKGVKQRIRIIPTLNGLPIASTCAAGDAHYAGMAVAATVLADAGYGDVHSPEVMIPAACFGSFYATMKCVTSYGMLTPLPFTRLTSKLVDEVMAAGRCLSKLSALP